MSRTTIRIAAWVLAVALAAPAMADDIGDKIDAARAANGKGDMLRALAALQAAEALLATRLLDQFAKVMPPPPSGWDATAAESEPLDAVGGGFTVTRGYQKGESVLNATLTVDNPSVANSVALFQPGPGTGDAGTGWRAVSVGADPAMLRYDPASGEGEIVLVVQTRAALQIEGSAIPSDQALVAAAQGWNLPALRKLLGL